MMIEEKYRYITDFVQNELSNGGTVGNSIINNLCKEHGIDAKHNIREVKESVEIALMRCARSIASKFGKTQREKYDAIIELYNRQPIVGGGGKVTLTQKVMQQYSTSLPIAYLMSEFVKGNGSSQNKYFEPSAGNGFLTIALPQENTICNEIDDYRTQNLREEHFQKVIQQDGRNPFEFDRSFDGVVTNPPFLKGEIDEMIFNALNTMKDTGRCAILRDGWNEFEDYLGTMLRRKNLKFFDRIFAEYNVVKVINLNSNKVYSKQGAHIPMQIILVDGRRSVINDDSTNRVFNPAIDKIELAGFEELWIHFHVFFEIEKRTDLQEKEIKLIKYKK